ncbi:prophage DLP12 integrase [Escherichia coli UMEA 3323-1]|nr:prophage DLP12 integrase [Escherichia coli UMEA 3323-1]
MSLFRRNEIWYASYSLPGGKRIKESLGTKDKRQAQELHDKRKAELWRVEKLGDLPDVTFEEACLRWLEEKADKKSLDSDKSRIEFWLEHFEGIRLKDISEAKIYSVNRPGFPGECFICELRLPDHRFRWKHNKLFLLLPEEYGPAFPAIVDCYTSPPT